MSEKITFGELIESIAEETNHSKKFTHDFIKDFVDVINGGLQDDGNVNIAGFGKFELRRMEERDGYNPQTEEKITIPAHNKVVFKPYKDLRELVNAPYAHLESELIEEDATADEESEDTDASDQDDFIPTAPPTSHQDDIEADAEDEEEAPFNLEDEITPLGSDSENESEKDDEEDPFDLDNDIDQPKDDEAPIEDSNQDEEDEDNGDIVEFNSEGNPSEEEENDDDFNIDNFISSIEPSETESTENSDAQADASQDDTKDSEAEEPVSDQDTSADEEERDPFNLDSSEEETEDDLNEFMGSSEESEEETVDEETSEEKVEEEKTAEDTSDADEDHEDEKSRYAPNFEDTEDATEEKDEKEEAADTPSFASKRHSRNRTSKMPIIAAAAVVLLLVAAGAWYFTTSSDSSTSEMATSQPTSTAEVTDQQDDQQQSSTNTQAQAPDQQAAQQNQQRQTSSTGSASQKTESADKESLEIEEGQTLWSIAEDKYGNPRLWPWIYGNNGSLKDPDLILAGNSLSVPLPSGPQNTLNATDSVGVAKGYLSTYRWYKDNQSSIARDHLWAAKSYYDNIRSIADIQIDKADLTYANQAR